MNQNNVVITIEDGSEVHLLNVSAYGYDVTDMDNIQMFFNYCIIEGNPEGQFIIPLKRAKRVTVNEDSSLYEEVGEPIMLGGVDQ